MIWFGKYDTSILLEDIDNLEVLTIAGKWKYAPHETKQLWLYVFICICLPGCGKPAIGTPFAEVEPSATLA